MHPAATPRLPLVALPPGGSDRLTTARTIFLPAAILRVFRFSLPAPPARRAHGPREAS
jgi:hypothetical protein